MREYFFLAVVVISAPGCIVVGSRERFEYVQGDSVEEGAFIPRITCAHTESQTKLPFFRVDREHAPYDLELTLYDQEGAESASSVVTTVIELLTVESESSGIKTIISAELPEATRTFEAVHRSELDSGNVPVAKRFSSVIENNESFTITLVGYGVTSSGARVPFRVVNPYRYDGHKWTCWTTLHELNGV